MSFILRLIANFDRWLKTLIGRPVRMWSLLIGAFAFGVLTASFLFPFVLIVHYMLLDKSKILTLSSIYFVCALISMSLEYVGATIAIDSLKQLAAFGIQSKLLQEDSYMQWGDFFFGTLTRFNSSMALKAVAANYSFYEYIAVHIANILIKVGVLSGGCYFFHTQLKSLLKSYSKFFTVLILLSGGWALYVFSVGAYFMIKTVISFNV